MPAVTPVILYADLPWPEKVLAEEVVRVTVNWKAVGGEGGGHEAVELYALTGDREQLLKDLARWFEAGHSPGTKPTPEDSPLLVRRPGQTSARDQRREVREFVDAYNIRSRKGKDRPAYHNPSGHWWYYAWLLKLFDAWVEAGRPAPGTGWEPPPPETKAA